VDTTSALTLEYKFQCPTAIVVPGNIISKITSHLRLKKFAEHKIKNVFTLLKKLIYLGNKKKTLSNFWVLTIVFINIFLVNEKPDYLTVENGFILAWRDKNRITNE